MLGSFGCRLRRVMTLNAGNRCLSINTAILGDVIGVAKLYAAQLCLRSKYDNVWWLLSFLR
jgi:hypothetical protein